MARPPKDINKDLVEKLALIHCTIEEIALVCGCSRDTLERRFRPVIEAGRAKGRERLRRWQWEAAEKGNVTAMIWLGKQYLAQSDKVEKVLIDGESSSGLSALEQIRKVINDPKNERKG